MMPGGPRPMSTSFPIRGSVGGCCAVVEDMLEERRWESVGGGRVMEILETSRGVRSCSRCSRRPRLRRCLRRHIGRRRMDPPAVEVLLDEGLEPAMKLWRHWERVESGLRRSGDLVPLARMVLVRVISRAPALGSCARRLHQGLPGELPEVVPEELVEEPPAGLPEEPAEELVEEPPAGLLEELPGELVEELPGGLVEAQVRGLGSGCFLSLRG